MKVIGIDPGPTPGLVMLHCAGARIIRAEAVQCTEGALIPMLYSLTPQDVGQLRIGVELFVPRGRMTADQRLTQNQVANLERMHAAVLTARSASQVKAWATDERLQAAGLLELVKGMRHAKDAARHALFTAVTDGLIPDPLSTNSSRKAAQ